MPFRFSLLRKGRRHKGFRSDWNEDGIIDWRDNLS